MKAIKWLDAHFEEAILVFLLIVIACVELVQVVCRNVPFLPALTWAEELCRFAWIATVFLSLPYTIRNSNMLRVSVLIDSLPDHLHNLLNIAVDLVTGSMMVLLTYSSIGVMQRTLTSGETSPAMLWPMWIMYLIVLIGFARAVVRSVQMVIIHIIHFNERPVTYIEEQMEREAAQDWVVPATIAMDGAGAAAGSSFSKGGDE